MRTMSPSARVRADDVDELTVADVMHGGVASMPPTVTVGELREWFGASASRRLAVIADDGRYRGSLAPADLAADVRADQPALAAAPAGPTLSPETPAATGRDLVAATATRRIPVVDAEGRFLGVLAMTTDLQYFACRPAPPTD